MVNKVRGSVIDLPLTVDSPPTSTSYPAGTVAYNSTSNNPVGWKYSGTAWVAFGEVKLLASFPWSPPAVAPLATGSGGSLKTINSESLSGSGNIPLQTPLVSGTSIKTVNGLDLLGSGNIAIGAGGTIALKTINSASIEGTGDIPLQVPLVSGTNVKTVNGTSILGSGNIAISASASVGYKSLTADFGAVGDALYRNPATGIYWANAGFTVPPTDNTAAFAAACAYMETNKVPVYIPPGGYATGAFALDLDVDQSYGGFYGFDPRTTRIIFNSALGSGIAGFTVSSASGTTYQGDLKFSNLTFIAAGGGASDSACVRVYDLAWTSFDNCKFWGAETAFDCKGGVNVVFEQCGFLFASYGLKVTKYTRTGGGWPNAIKMNGGVAGNNTVCGIYFDDGRQFILDGVQIEGNGTTPGNVAHAGVYVGPSIGTETGLSGNAQPGIIMQNCWLEANKGIADVYLRSGLNSLDNCLFWSTNAEVTNNVRVVGGKYFLESCDSAHTFTALVPNVYETGVYAGNSIKDCEFSYLTYDNTKTTLITGTELICNTVSGNTVKTRGQPVPNSFGTVLGAYHAKPVLITGFSNTGSAADVVITHGKTLANFADAAYILTPLDPGAGAAATPELIAFTTTSFTVRKKAYTGAGATTVNYGFSWAVIGSEA